LDALGILYGLTLRQKALTAATKTISLHTRPHKILKEERKKSVSRSPVLSTLAGVLDGSPDAGESPLLFKGFVVEVEAYMKVLEPTECHL